MNSRFRVREIVVLVFALIILLPILFVALPGAVKAQESPEASTYQIEYWRRVTVLCFVKASNFAGLKVDWKSQYGSSYLGDCSFSIEYGASYTGSTGMSNLAIIDNWKKGMTFGLDQPYYYATGPTGYGICTGVAFTYTPSTGSALTTIQSTPSSPWQCGAKVTVITRSGLDLSVFSPKPSVSGTVFDDSGAKVKPEAMVPGSSYTLQVEMKPFAVKSPALAKKSGFQALKSEIHVNGVHAALGTGMYLRSFDPYWAGPVGGVPPGQAEAYAMWQYQNDVGAALPHLMPTTPKAVFPPSLIRVNMFQKSHVSVAPNEYDSIAKTGFLYEAHVELYYVNKGISFITGDDIYFSGNPLGIAPILNGPNDMNWELELYAAYPDWTCSFSC